jgi:hypothetical protein
LEEKLREREIELKLKCEEIESLQFNNARLSKRIESVIEEYNHKSLIYLTHFIMKESETKSSFLGNLIGGR